jgi:hypothetical protein
MCAQNCHGGADALGTQSFCRETTGRCDDSRQNVVNCEQGIQQCHRHAVREDVLQHAVSGAIVRAQAQSVKYAAILGQSYERLPVIGRWPAR